MAGLVRFVVAAALTLLMFGLGWLGAFASFDRLLGDARFNLLSRPASGDVVFVEIDSGSLVQLGIWPWPRQVHAKILDRLMELGARDVVFDVDFSARSTPEGDRALTEALRRAGGFTYLASFEQPNGAHVVLTRPLPEFLTEGTPVLVNVSTDAQGMVDRVPTRTVSGAPIISLAEALAGQEVPPGDIIIDYGIDLRTIDRIPVRLVLDGRADAGRIRDKQVIVGAGAVELRDIFAVPRFGFVPGALVQAEAAETLKAGRSLQRWSEWPALVAALVLALLLSWGRRSRLGHTVAIVVGVMLLAELLALACYGLVGALADTGAFHVTILGLFALDTAHALLTEYAARQRAQARLAYLARHDEATGLKSRRGLIEALRFRQGAQTIFAVGLLRLDMVRGALGPEVHNEALKALGERLSGIEAAEVGLIGSDMLALGMPGSQDAEGIARTEARIRAALQPALNVEGHVVHVDIAIGAVSGEGTPEELMGRAELALARALRRPGAPAVLFAPKFEAEIDRRRRIDLGLRQAVANGELSVVFQPQVGLKDEKLCGVEALVRWRHPDLGDVSPAEFVPLAEETGLIVPLGAFVLEQACREVLEWNWDGKLAVNVSAAQVQLADVAGTVERALARTGLPPDRLDIEITESLLVDRTGRLETMIAALRARGVGVAIDDFGTGYSALSYLSGFTFDKLKIDQSFVRGLDTKPAQAKVVAAIVELAKALGKVTVAEGVETEEQRDLLARMGCEIGQGYLFGRPAKGGDIEAMLVA